MDKEELELESLKQSLGGNPEICNSGKFSIVSKIYGKKFKKVTFMIFNSETGEIIKKVLENDI